MFSSYHFISSQENNMVQVIQQESGRRAGVPMTVPCTQLRLADLVVGGKVVVVSGQNAGVVRTVMVNVTLVHDPFFVLIKAFFVFLVGITSRRRLC